MQFYFSVLCTFGSFFMLISTNITVLRTLVSLRCLISCFLLILIRFYFSVLSISG